MTRCAKCGKLLSPEMFYSGGTQRSWCKICSQAYARSRYAENRDAILDYARAYYVRVVRPRRLMRNYGLTEAGFIELMQRFNWRCGICGSEDHLVIDHCHETGQIRGVLCNTCNRAIGQLGDTINRLKAAIKYLEEWE